MRGTQGAHNCGMSFALLNKTGDNMMKFLYSLIILITLVACGSSTENASDGPTEIGNRANLSLNFKKTDFSSYIEVSEDHKWLRFKFGFFPDGTNYDFTNNRVIIPCDFFNSIPEGVDVNLTAPLNPLCVQPYVIAAMEEGESLTVDGLVVLMDRKVFPDDFGFEITLEGVKNISNEEILKTVKGKLAEYYALVNAAKPISLK